MDELRRGMSNEEFVRWQMLYAREAQLAQADGKG